MVNKRALEPLINMVVFGALFDVEDKSSVVEQASTDTD
ncbi:hypothetical protein ES703_64624 [subsurface metagenome]